MIKEKPITQKSRTEDDDDLLHLFCCNPDRALCGLDLTDAAYDMTGPGDDDTNPYLCVVCKDLAEAPKVKCSKKCNALRRWRNERRWS